MNSITIKQDKTANKYPILKKYYTNTRPEVIKLVPSAAKYILDVGCGAGNLGKALKLRQSAKIHGVEIDKEAAKHACHHLDKVWNCSIETALPELPDNYYDCIIVADVLEHLYDPLNILLKLKKKLKKTGKLIASIPNIQNWEIILDLLQGKWDYCSEGILDRTHLRFFTRKSVKELFWSAGFRILNLSTNPNGEPPPNIILNSIKTIGLPEEKLARDGKTYQFLIEAEIPDLSSKPKVVIVILNQSSKNNTIECLSSIFQNNYPNFQCVMVDSDLTDDAITEIKSQFPDVILIKTNPSFRDPSEKNAGVLWALNKKADYILVLNNNTIIDTNCLQEFINYSLLTESAILGPASFYYDNPEELWTIGAIRKHTSPLGYKLLPDKESAHDYQNVLIVDSIVSDALFIKKDVFNSIGLFDERFSLYWEKHDLCARAINAGFECVFIPTARVWCKHIDKNKTSPLHIYFNTRDRLLWASKHCSRFEKNLIKLDTLQTVSQIFFPPFSIPHIAQPFPKRLLWGIASWTKTVCRRFNNPVNRAKLYGIRDFYIKRFGKYSFKSINVKAQNAFVDQ